MKTQAEVLDGVRTDELDGCLDGRDRRRLALFFPVKDWAVLGLKPAEGFDASTFVPTPWTREAIVVQLAGDLRFGFEKALAKRGISAGMMHTCVMQWAWILNDPLFEQADELYTQYGLPFFKAVALKYGLPNEIGDDVGDEFKYSAEVSSP